jgi:hypothetical protein
MIKNVFDNGYAECLILRTESEGEAKGEAVGLALVSRWVYGDEGESY